VRVLTRGLAMPERRTLPDALRFSGLRVRRATPAWMYAGMLKRAPDAATFQDNVTQVNNGSSLQSRVSLILSSAEYRSRFLP
jgi:hypothetical protein